MKNLFQTVFNFVFIEFFKYNICTSLQRDLQRIFMRVIIREKKINRIIRFLPKDDSICASNG